MIRADYLTIATIGKAAMVHRFFIRLSRHPAAIRGRQGSLYILGTLCFCLWSSAVLWSLVLD